MTRMGICFYPCNPCNPWLEFERIVQSEFVVTHKRMLPQPLIDAAMLAEQQLQMRGVRTRKIPRAEWNALPEKVQRLVPSWMPELMAAHSLLGLVMERRSLFPRESWCRYFPFWSPREFQDVLLCGDPNMEEDVIAKGFVPISNESDGDLWITPVEGDASAPVLLYRLTALERLPVFGSMAELMTVMSVSSESTHEA
jgi:hypothetical protein